MSDVVAALVAMAAYVLFIAFVIILFCYF